MTSPHHDPYGPTDQAPWAVPPPPIPSYTPPQPGQQSGPQDGLQTPPPAPAAAPGHRQQVRYADWGERVGATLVDWAIVFVPAMVLAGLGMGVGSTTLSVLVLDLVPVQNQSSASASLQLSDVLGSVLGIAAASAVLPEPTGPPRPTRSGPP